MSSTLPFISRFICLRPLPQCPVTGVGSLQTNKEHLTSVEDTLNDFTTVASELHHTKDGYNSTLHAKLNCQI